MKITLRDVDYVASLANLALTDAERARMQRDLNAILEYVDQLSELDTSNVEPMAQVSLLASVANPVVAPLRSDELRGSLPHDAAIRNAPQSDGTFFRVPKVIER